MNWMWHNLDLVAALTLDHLRQCALPLLCGLLFSIPLGWVAFRYARLRVLLLTTIGLLYVIPSLALFALLPPLLEISFLSETNLVIALAIYAVATMTRFAADAFSAVDDDLRSAAAAIGYSAWGRFFRVELPLAGPVILAGLRVTAASTISLATVGVLIGIRNLGYLFTNGYQRHILEEIFTGVLAVVVIAVVLDRLLAMLGRMLMPWWDGKVRS